MKKKIFCALALCLLIAVCVGALSTVGAIANLRHRTRQENHIPGESYRAFVEAQVSGDKLIAEGQATIWVKWPDVDAWLQTTESAPFPMQYYFSAERSKHFTDDALATRFYSTAWYIDADGYRSLSHYTRAVPDKHTFRR